LVVVGVSAIGVIASIYLTIVEVFVIEALCQYCVTSAALVLVAAAAVTVTARREGPLWLTIRRRRVETS